jgi:Protein of unknown function (DUF664)
MALRRYPMAAAGAPGRCGDCPAFIHGPMYGRMPLDHQFRHPQWGLLSLRWVYGHMIAEYARHLGHAGLLRECTDGATGE